MEQEIKIAWSTPRTQQFDIRDFALEVLGIAKENLERDGELLPSVFIVTGDSIQCAPIEFADHEEKINIYHAVVELAKSQNAVALITVNSMFTDNNFTEDWLDSYYPGKLEAEGAGKCILITVSGPGICNWCLELPYEHTTGGFKFSDISEESAGELGFLEGWASEYPKIQ
ncbi:MAG TPA: hypothetical protein VFR24_19770 [Candidatus Angelobacter sp.]|nr:hypothetical protein [Candidatus Angelobacter sp.]